VGSHSRLIGTEVSRLGDILGMAIWCFGVVAIAVTGIVGACKKEGASASQ